MQMIPRGGPIAGPPLDLTAYSPQSDLRNCGLPMLEQVVKRFHAGLDANQEPLPWLSQYLQAIGGTLDELGQGCKALTEAVVAVLRNPDTTLQNELQAHGFFVVPQGVQEAIVAQIGRQALGTTIYSIRDATPLGTEGPKAAMERLVAEGAALAAAIGPVVR